MSICSLLLSTVLILEDEEGKFLIAENMFYNIYKAPVPQNPMPKRIVGLKMTQSSKDKVGRSQLGLSFQCTVHGLASPSQWMWNCPNDNFSPGRDPSSCDQLARGRLGFSSSSNASVHPHLHKAQASLSPQNTLLTHTGPTSHLVGRLTWVFLI